MRGFLIRFLSIFVLAMCVSATTYAQNDRHKTAERQRIMAEMKTYKQEFLTRELEISKEQASGFFSEYNKMEEELRTIADQTRQLEKKVSTDASATDTEVEAASRALFEQKAKEGKVELEYYEKFKNILTPKQLLKLKAAERKFNQSLLKQHRRLTREGAKRK